ncbi:MAG: DUF6377 domain-containing protein [Prevotellaceae bacterium]|jgi:DNA-binding CsgD family transcriptional regulator|nr:DUF6377 domain-containing protein [Prevotellaceae bacterium]
MQVKLTLTACLLLFATLAFANWPLDSLLDQLCLDIEKKGAYDLQKERALQAKKQMLRIPNLQPEQEYLFNKELVEAYKKYTIDSAVFYAKQNLRLAVAAGRPDWLYETRLSLSLLYSTAGMYIEAEAILNSISKGKLPEHLLPLYYDAFRHFYRYYAQISGREEPLAQSAVYRDFLKEMLDKNSLQYKIVYAEQVIFQNSIAFSVAQAPRDLDAVEALLLTLFGTLSPDHRDYALTAFMLGNLYAIRQQPELQQQYLALSALADIRNSVKDNASLHALALALYKSDDLGRAHRFMQSAISDMEFCNVRFRVTDLSAAHTIISSAYMEKELHRRGALQRYLLVISLLSVVLLVVIVYVVRQVYRVLRIRRKLYDANVTMRQMNHSMLCANDELQKLNARLQEANRVKEEYIAQFFDMCSAYIDKWEDYRKTLNKKAISKRYEDLAGMLRSNTIADEERKKLYDTFDSVFLHLYPTFVEAFNALLAPEKQVLPKPGDMLNTELRIFALIRLGISDSIKIAGFLRYSSSTVYNYRTQIRNKAISRDDFEQEVMKIGSLQGKK